MLRGGHHHRGAVPGGNPKLVIALHRRDTNNLEVMRRMPASAASVVEAMARGPYAREVAAVEADVRQAMGSEVSAALHAYRNGNEVVIPHRSHLVQAQVA
jgi:hypothetical protein